MNQDVFFSHLPEDEEEDTKVVAYMTRLDAYKNRWLFAEPDKNGECLGYIQEFSSGDTRLWKAVWYTVDSTRVAGDINFKVVKSLNEAIDLIEANGYRIKQEES